MICNCCHAVINAHAGCADCGEACCDRCLNVSYSNFSYYDGGVDVEYICDRCKGCLIIYPVDPYWLALYQAITAFPVPEYGDTSKMAIYLFLRCEVFWFRYPPLRELPQLAQSKNDAFYEQYQISRTFFADFLRDVRVTVLDEMGWQSRTLRDVRVPRAEEMERSEEQCY